jgi:hypothetical protein
MVNYIPSAVILCTRVAGSIEMRGRERESSIAGRAIGVVLAVRCYDGFEERLGEEDDDQEA